MKVLDSIPALVDKQVHQRLRDMVLEDRYVPELPATPSTQQLMIPVHKQRD